MSGITAGKVFFLTDMISVKPHRIASRTLSLPVAAAETAAQPEWVLYAMDQEETISSETSPNLKSSMCWKASFICWWRQSPIN